MFARNALKILTELEATFSNTPLIRVEVKYLGKRYVVYGKYEVTGLSSSGKDRITRYILKHAYEHNLLHEGETVVEVSSGNTGISLSLLCGMLGNRMRIVIPDWLSIERYKLLEMNGAEVIKITPEEGGFVEARRRAIEFSKMPGFFSTKQFDNPLNTEAHIKSTMLELFNKVIELGNKPIVFVAGYGTGGMVMAARSYTNQNNISCLVHPLEPSTAALLTEGIKEKPGSIHRIEGIVDDFVPTLLKPKELDSPVVVDDGDAILMSKLINRSGVSFGISSGANLLGCIKRLHELEIEGENNVALTIFCDSSVKYISTDLFRNIPSKEHFVSANTEVISIDIVA